jgi:hypothetical protein
VNAGILNVENSNPLINIELWFFIDEHTKTMILAGHSYIYEKGGKFFDLIYTRWTKYCDILAGDFYEQIFQQNKY